MSEKQKNHVIYADEETHWKLSMMAVRKKMSIKQCLKELVQKAESTILKPGESEND
jgi:hypothetical protein